MSNAIKNIIRTFVPAVVGILVAWGTKAWANLSTGQFALLAPIASTAYYSIIRFAEERWPSLSWLLGALPVAAAPAPPATLPSPETPAVTAVAPAVAPATPGAPPAA